MSPIRLSELSLAARLGLTGMLATLLIGFAASASHMQKHHENRDGQPGLSWEDFMGAYHGVEVTAPMLTSLEGGHPDDLSQAERMLLLKWLRADQISENYDNLDLGDSAPAEIVQSRCLGCHARAAQEGDGIGQSVPLEFWDDIEKLSFSRSLSPPSIEILIASTHTHALSLAMIAIVLGALLLMTRWSQRLQGGLILIGGLALFLDLACWWIVRSQAGFLVVLIGAGVLFSASMLASILLVLADLWLPRRGA